MPIGYTTDQSAPEFKPGVLYLKNNLVLHPAHGRKVE